MSTAFDYHATSAQRRAYDTDLSDAEWAVVRHLIETVQRGPGPRRSVDLQQARLQIGAFRQRRMGRMVGGGAVGSVGSSC